VAEPYPIEVADRTDGQPTTIMKVSHNTRNEMLGGGAGKMLDFYTEWESPRQILFSRGQALARLEWN